MLEDELVGKARDGDDDAAHEEHQLGDEAEQRNLRWRRSYPRQRQRGCAPHRIATQCTAQQTDWTHRKDTRDARGKYSPSSARRPLAYGGDAHVADEEDVAAEECKQHRAGHGGVRPKQEVLHCGGGCTGRAG